MKEIKDIQIKVRITPTEKKQIEKYCEAHNLNTSDFLRMAFSRVLAKEGKE